MFEKLTGFNKKVSDLPDQPALTPIELKAQFDAAPEELRVHLNKIIDDIQTSLEDIKNQESFIPATLQNGWTNYGGIFQNAEYMKDRFGFVHIRGFIRNGQVGSTAFILPVGYRPGKSFYAPTVSNDAASFLDVQPNGSVGIPSRASNAWVSLNIAPFKAEG